MENETQKPSELSSTDKRLRVQITEGDLVHFAIFLFISDEGGDDW